MMHIAMIYGGMLWYYYEIPPDIITSILLIIFIAANGAFFMGFFFMISCYFIPGSYNQKGPLQFLKDRWLRLGLPILFYAIIIDPLIKYAIAVKVTGFNQSLPDFCVLYIRDIKGLGLGPLWFIQALLIFTVLYIAGRCFISPPKNNFRSTGKFPDNTKIVIFTLALGIISFIVRIWFPIGWWFKPISIEVAHLPQYMSLFIIGLVAYERNWFFEIPLSIVRFWLIVIGSSSLIMLTIFLASERNISFFLGGLHWHSFAFAIWEHLFCIGIIISLLTWFRKNMNRQPALLKTMSTSAYAAYIIHAPVLIFLALSFKNSGLHPLLKFVIISPLTIFLSFLIGNYLKKLPLVRKIL